MLFLIQMGFSFSADGIDGIDGICLFLNMVDSF